MCEQDSRSRQQQSRPLLFWKILIIANVVIGLLGLYGVFQLRLAFAIRGSAGVVTDDMVFAQSYHIRTPGANGAFQREGDCVALGAFSNNGSISLRVPSDSPPEFALMANGPLKAGAMVRIVSEAHEDIALSFCDKNRRQRLVMGVQASGEPYLQAYNAGGHLVWSIPVSAIPPGNNEGQ